MPFDREPTRNPARIARTTLHIAVLEDAQGVVTYDKGTAEIGVVMSDGSQFIRPIQDLNSHLTAGIRANIKSALDAVHAKAKTEIL